MALPDPELLPRVIQAGVPVTDQAQLLSEVVTPTLPFPPAAAKDALDDESVNEQGVPC